MGGDGTVLEVNNGPAGGSSVSSPGLTYISAGQKTKTQFGVSRRERTWCGGYRRSSVRYRFLVLATLVGGEGKAGNILHSPHPVRQTSKLDFKRIMENYQFNFINFYWERE